MLLFANQNIYENRIHTKNIGFVIKSLTCNIYVNENVVSKQCSNTENTELAKTTCRLVGNLVEPTHVTSRPCNKVLQYELPCHVNYLHCLYLSCFTYYATTNTNEKINMFFCMLLLITGRCNRGWTSKGHRTLWETTTVRHTYNKIIQHNVKAMQM